MDAPRPSEIELLYVDEDGIARLTFNAPRRILLMSEAEMS